MVTCPLPKILSDPNITSGQVFGGRLKDQDNSQEKEVLIWKTLV